MMDSASSSSSFSAALMSASMCCMVASGIWSCSSTFLATAYCQTGTTATGTYTTVGRTLAVNPGVIPYGTHVWLYLEDGTLVGDYYAEDTGGNMLEHSYVIDIYMGTDYDTCIEWGVKRVSVYVEKDTGS